jgi:hypothetical protein
MVAKCLQDKTIAIQVIAERSQRDWLLSDSKVVAEQLNSNFKAIARQS